LRARAALSPALLSNFVRASLDSLGYSYRKNEGAFVVEFEVITPHKMLIRVEDLTRPQSGFPLRSSLRVESAIEILRVVGSGETEGGLRDCASRFLVKLRSLLPKEPWKGIGFPAVGSEKANWERLADL